MMFDELDGRERQVMQPHMGSCADCQAEQRETKRIFMVVQTAVRSGGWVPDHFTETVMAKLPERSGRRLRHDRLNHRLMRKTMQMAASILVGTLLVGLYVVYYDHLPHFAQAAGRMGNGRDIFGEHAVRIFHPNSSTSAKSSTSARSH